MKFFIGVMVFCLSGMVLFSQECGSDIMFNELLKNNPELKENTEKLEAYCKQYSEQASTRVKKAASVKIIPVVFHVMHNYGPENISDAQIIDAVNRLNIDFRKLRSDTNLIAPAFKSIHADCEIEFRLAQLDPNGNCTNGITRTRTTLTYNANDNVKQLINWEHTEYFNIWVVSNIDIGFTGVGNIAGYAYRPGTGNNQDGVVILSDYTGSIGTSGLNRSTVLAHEAGHYLNLPHTWGSTNNCGDPGNCFSDDGISDTPNTIGNCHSCDLTSSTCGVLDNVQNIMEYSQCRAMFTEGQKLWMEAALNISWTGRQNLWSATNLINTGVNGPSPLCAPKADFFSNTNIVCVGSGVTFRDASWNGNPTSWNWSFPGANISSSTSSSETISYPSPGIYTVSLSVSNSAGTDMASKTGYIQVVPSLATHTLSSYTESFESAGIPNAHWSIFDENGFNSWTSTTAAAYSGNASILLNNYTPGSYDELYSAGIDVSAVQNPLLSFMLAYTQKSNEDDKLEIFASANCGQTWNQRYQKTGSLLATAPATFNYFIPTSSQWRKEYINLSPFINSDNVRIKFKFTSAGGNNIYIDDINLSSYFVGIDEKENSGNSIHVYPNPLENTSVITMKLSERSSIELTLFNIMGQKVNSFVSGEKLPGEYTFPLNNNLSKGVYLLILNDGKQQINKKIVVN